MVRPLRLEFPDALHHFTEQPAAWPWSSYAASIGAAPAEPFLAVDGLLARFAKRRDTARLIDPNNP